MRKKRSRGTCRNLKNVMADSRVKSQPRLTCAGASLGNSLLRRTVEDKRQYSFLLTRKVAQD